MTRCSSSTASRRDWLLEPTSPGSRHWSQGRQPRMRRTDVRPMPRRLAISDLFSPWRWSFPDLGGFLLRRVRAPVRLAFLARVRDAGLDALAKDVSLELGEDGEEPSHGAAAVGGEVERLGQGNEAHSELAQRSAPAGSRSGRKANGPTDRDAIRGRRRCPGGARPSGCVTPTMRLRGASEYVRSCSVVDVSIDWKRQRLGKRTDREIAERLGVTTEEVRRERVRRGFWRAMRTRWSGPC